MGSSLPVEGWAGWHMQVLVRAAPERLAGEMYMEKLRRVPHVCDTGANDLPAPIARWPLEMPFIIW